MLNNLFDLTRKIGIFIVCTSDVPETKEEFVNKMSNAGMISIGEYDASSYNCQKIIDDMGEYLSKFTDDEVVGYILKYYYGMENNRIYKQKLWLVDGPIVCIDLDIRRVERIHMSIKRRKWNQPKYTNPTFKTIDDMVGDEKFKSAVRLLGVGPLTIDEFRYYCLDRYLSRDHIKDISHSTEFNIVKKSVSELCPEVEFTDVTDFPWNMLYFMEGDRNGVSIYAMMKAYMATRDISYADLVDNVDTLSKVIKYNMSAFIGNQTKLDIMFDRFIERKSFMNIKVPSGIHNDYLSTARIQQLFEAGLNKICNALHDGKFLFDGFELLVRHYSKPDEIAEAIIENVTSVLPLFTADIHRVLRGVIPMFDMFTLKEMVDAVYENPLILSIIEYGFDKGLVIANKELRVQHGMDETPVLPNNMYDLGMSYRTTNALVRAGIGTPMELVSSTFTEISNVRGIGKLAIEEINRVLNVYGYSISDNKEEI
ncbi:MAG: hypothetical protein J5614_03405 [Paludibacteraceae bacterium]|nr:hypothetical protein [Paludibacteraceae bacterium]